MHYEHWTNFTVQTLLHLRKSQMVEIVHHVNLIYPCTDSNRDHWLEYEWLIQGIWVHWGETVIYQTFECHGWGITVFWMESYSIFMALYLSGWLPQIINPLKCTCQRIQALVKKVNRRMMKITLNSDYIETINHSSQKKKIIAAVLIFAEYHLLWSTVCEISMQSMIKI